MNDATPIMPATLNTLVVGIGSFQGDDRAGWQVVADVQACWKREQARGTAPPWLELAARIATAPADLLDWLPGPDQLVLIDACVSLETSEPWRRFPDPELRAASTRSFSGHLVGVPDVLEIARTLDRLPRHLVLWAVAGRSFEPGAELGAGPRDAARAVAERIVIEAMLRIHHA